jgi:hypothetical protein
MAALGHFSDGVTAGAILDKAFPCDIDLLSPTR